MASDINLRTLSVTVMLLCLAGCGRDDFGSSSNRNRDEQAGAEALPCGKPMVLAIVDGKPITDADLKRHVLLLKTIHFRNRKPLDEVAFRRWGNSMAPKVLPQLVESALMEQKFNELKLSASQEDIAQTVGKFNRLMGSSAKNLDELALLFGTESDIFRSLFAFDCKMNALYASNTNLSVTAADICRFYRNATNRLDRCKVINASSMQRISSAYARLKRGEDWDVVATNVSEDAVLEPSYADNWRDWQSLSIHKVEPLELREALTELKEGEFTSPIELDEGMAIVKIVSKDDDFVNLARILTRMAVPYVIPDEATAKSEIINKKRIHFQKSILKELRERYKVEYPKGRNFKYEIWPSPAAGKKSKPVSK